MNRRNLNSNNGDQSNLSWYGRAGIRHSHPQQNPGPESRTDQATGEVNYYYGSNYNLTFVTPGSYDLDISFRQIIDGGNSGVPLNNAILQSINTAPSSELGQGNNSNRQHYGMDPRLRYNTVNGQDVQTRNTDQQLQQSNSDFNIQYSGSQVQGPVATEAGGMNNGSGQAYGLNNNGQELILAPSTASTAALNDCYTS